MSSVGVLLIGLGVVVIVTMGLQGLSPQDAGSEVKGLLYV